MLYTCSLPPSVLHALDTIERLLALANQSSQSEHLISKCENNRVFLAALVGENL